MTVDQLVEENMSWAATIARNVARKLPPSFDISDLEQEAYIAVWRAAEKFDASKGVPFRGYAYMAVRGAVLMACRRRSYTEATGDELDQDYACERPSQEAKLIGAFDIEKVRWRTSKRRKRVADLMPLLSEADRYLVKRIYLDGEDLETLAGVWCMDAGAFKKRVRGAVRMLVKLRRAK